MFVFRLVESGYQGATGSLFRRAAQSSLCFVSVVLRRPPFHISPHNARIALRISGNAPPRAFGILLRRRDMHRRKYGMLR